MAGSWGGDSSTPDLWASLHTVVNAEFADLEPLLELENQFERQFVEQEAAQAAQAQRFSGLRQRRVRHPREWSQSRVPQVRLRRAKRLQSRSR